MNDSPISYLIGVDGGGTGCRAVIGTRADGILGRATGGRANATTDIKKAINSVRDAIAAAAAMAGLPIEALRDATAHVGLAGVLTDNIASEVAAGLPINICTVTDDCPTTIAGALNGADGYVAAIGTGSFIGTSKNGMARHIGGYGFRLSDQASGAWLGRGAITQALLCHDGLAPHSDLTKDLMKRFGSAPARLVEFAQTARPGDFGTFAPDIMQAAKSGDIHGRTIVEIGAGYIADGLSALGFAKGDMLCLMGGLGPHYQDFLPTALIGNIIAPKASAVDGAFHLARLQSEQSA